MLYFAFGSNLYHKQMKKRCKDSVYIKCHVLKNYRLYFRNNFWIHETFLGKFATTHPIRKSEKYLMQELPFFIKYFSFISE